MAISKLLIANRGEIAVRIIRAARELGLRTVQAVSAADRDMMAARLADEVVEVGSAHASKSYLNKDAVLAAALASGADALHPGYGFLSENAEFAQACADAGLMPGAVASRAATIPANARVEDMPQLAAGSSAFVRAMRCCDFFML